MSVTWDTPLVDRIAGFMTQSASVLRSIMEVLSDWSPTMRISPMMLDCGASRGVTPVGREDPSEAIFSDTICLAR